MPRAQSWAIPAGVNSGPGGADLDVLQFLAAYQQRNWGLESADLSQRRLAEWSTAQGYATSLSAVKNGTRAQPQEGAVPAAPEVLGFLDVLKARFPGLEVERFLIAEG